MHQSPTAQRDKLVAVETTPADVDFATPIWMYQALDKAFVLIFSATGLALLNDLYAWFLVFSTKPRAKNNDSEKLYDAENKLNERR